MFSTGSICSKYKKFHMPRPFRCLPKVYGGGETDIRGRAYGMLTSISNSIKKINYTSVADYIY